MTVKRLAALPALIAVAMVLALAGAYGAFGLQAPWGLPLFLTALALGFGAQVWFVAGLIRGGRA
jgi:hypothetical protein